MGGRPRRILVLIKGLGIGGAEKLISSGAWFWDREQFDYHVAYVLPWKDQLVRELEDQGVEVHFLGTRRGMGPSLLPRLRRLVKDLEIDLVHAHLPATAIAARLASPVPVVYTEHNVADSYRRATRLLNRATYGRNAAVIAVSDAVASSVAGWPGPTRQVIPNGVAVHEDPDVALAAREELGLSESDPMVVHVGNIRPGKGHEVLVQAAAHLIESHPDATVVSIGGEKYPGDLERIRALAEQAGLGDRFRLLGRRPDALAFVETADVFVNPSAVEGLPVAVLEAMALSRAVVATAAGGVPTIVKDGETGILVEPGDPVALAEGAARMLSDRPLAERVGAAARDMVAADYGLQPMVRATEDIYRMVLDA